MIFGLHSVRLFPCTNSNKICLINSTHLKNTPCHILHFGLWCIIQLTMPGYTTYLWRQRATLIVRHSEGLTRSELTDASGQRVVPLSQSIRDGFTVNGRGAVERVAWVTLEHHWRTHGEVVANALAEARLWNRAALRGAGPWYSCERILQEKCASLESFTSQRSVTVHVFILELHNNIAKYF